MSQSFHLVVSVRGLLRKPTAELKRDLRWITDGGGKRYRSVDALKDALMDELAQGHEVLPTGACDKHDWKTGCQGHEEG